jgi:acyl CoA:acetate/3-ketoacid CoA transferase
MRNKIVDAAEAVAIIRSGDTVASSGFVGVGTPDEIIKALEQRFVQTGEPRDRWCSPQRRGTAPIAASTAWRIPA